MWECHLKDCDKLEDDELDLEKTSKELWINHRSILFELKHFDVDILVTDVMHDLLEGTLQYEAKLILQHVLQQKFLSYSMFAKLLEALELGYMETDNRPSEIPSSTMNSTDRSLGQKGSII